MEQPSSRRGSRLIKTLVVIPFVAAALVLVGFVCLVLLATFGTPLDMLDSALPEPSAADCGDDQPGPGALVAIDPVDGTRLWSRRVGDVWAIASTDGVIAFATPEGVVRGVSIADGDEIWCDDTSVSNARDIAVAGGVVATISDRAVIAFDPATGEQRWRTDVPPAMPPTDGQEGSPVPTIAIDPEVSGLVGGTDFWVTSGAADGSGAQRIDPLDGALLEANTVDPTAAELDTQTVDEFELTTLREYREEGQEIDLTVTDLGRGVDLWSATVPGYEPSLVESVDRDPVVIVIDQTAGTRRVFGETVLTAYRGVDGHQLWQRPVPLAASYVSQAKPGTVVVAAGTELIGIDVVTGETVWEADHGSPGRQRPWRIDGRYRDVVVDGDGATMAGLIVAERRYRD